MKVISEMSNGKNIINNNMSTFRLFVWNNELQKQNKQTSKYLR